MKEQHKQNLLEAADRLDGGQIVGEFKMLNICACVIGQSVRYFEGRKGAWDYCWAAGASQRMFGIPETEINKWSFCFGGHWPADAHLAAVRLRYVAIHGDAPSRDQWDRFEAEQIVEAEEAELVAA